MSLADSGSEQGVFAPALEKRVGAVVDRLALIVALLGGFVLVAITIMTVLSISGRAFLWAGLGPVPGDFELVESGTAFAVFAFLPWCQMQRGHVTVDILVDRFGAKSKAGLALIGNVILSVVSSIILWRLILGMLDKKQYSETTFILQFPIWWSYLAACLGAVMFVLVSLYTVWRSANEMTGSGERKTQPVAH